jgi:hypothetical protein
MRIRTAVPVLAGALVLGAVLVPSAAFADGTTPAPGASASPSPSPTATPKPVKPVLTSVKFSSAPLGVKGQKYRITFTATAKSSAGIKDIHFLPYSVAEASGYVFTATEVRDYGVTLTKKAGTATTFTGSYTESGSIAADDWANVDAGLWHNAVLVDGVDGGVYFTANAESVDFKRADRLSVHASAHTVKKNTKVRLSSTLTRADWNTEKYAGYAKEPVKVEYRNAGSTAWHVLAKVKSNAKGQVAYTTKETRNRSYRFVFAGNTTSGATSSGITTVKIKK